MGNYRNKTPNKSPVSSKRSPTLKTKKRKLKIAARFGVVPKNQPLIYGMLKSTTGKATDGEKRAENVPIWEGKEENPNSAPNNWGGLLIQAKTGGEGGGIEPMGANDRTLIVERKDYGTSGLIGRTCDNNSDIRDEEDGTNEG